MLSRYEMNWDPCAGAIDGRATYKSLDPKPYQEDPRRGQKETQV